MKTIIELIKKLPTGRIKNRVGTKVLFPFILLQIFLIGGLIYLIFSLISSENDVKASMETVKKSNILSTRIFELQKEIETYLLSYRFDQRREYIVTIYSNQIKIARVLDEFYPVVTSNQGKNLVKRYIEEKEESDKLVTNLIFAIQENDEFEIARSFQKWEIGSESINKALTNLVKHKLSLLGSSVGVFEVVISRIYTLAMLVFLGTLVLVVILAFYMRKNITRPISELSFATKKISQGDFSVNLDTKSSDEIGDLSASIKEMAKKLKLYYKNLKDEVKRKEEELKKSRELDEKKDEFISAASHELRTPLTSQKVFIQLLKRDVEKNGDNKYYNFVTKILEQSDKLTKLVNNMLDVSRIQTRRMDFEKQAFNINELMKNIVDELQKTTKKHKILIEGEIDKEVYADKEKLYQVLTNLLSNAIKYSPDSNKIYIQVKENKDCAQVCVKDSGIGIEKKHKEKIFDRFFRVSGKNEKTFPGLGMGLYISSEIVKQNGGKIWVESSKKKGSSFYFTVPFPSAKI